MKNKIRIVIDAIFSLILFCVIFYALLKRYTTQNLALFSSFILSLLFLSIYVKGSDKQIQNAKEKENMKNFFIFTKVNPAKYFKKILEKRYEITEENGKLLSQKSEVCFALSLSPLSVSFVVDAYKNRSKDKIVIMCFSYDKKAMLMAKSLPCDIVIFDEEKVFKLLSSFKGLPQEKIEIKRKYPLSTLLKDFSSSRLSKRLFVSSFIIALFSFITPFKNYYAFLAIILLILCFLPYFLRLFYKIKENTLR